MHGFFLVASSIARQSETMFKKAEAHGLKHGHFLNFLGYVDPAITGFLYVDAMRNRGGGY